jgi:excinuclease ABC subunit B
VRSAVKDSITEHLKASGWNEDLGRAAAPVAAEPETVYHSVDDLRAEIKELEREMHRAAEALEFEQAAEYRDRIRQLTEFLLAC